MNYPKRIKGHKLSLEWSGEYGQESSSTGTCICGWSETCSSQKQVRHEYRCHLRTVWEKKQSHKKGHS